PLVLRGEAELRQVAVVAEPRDGPEHLVARDAVELFGHSPTPGSWWAGSVAADLAASARTGWRCRRALRPPETSVDQPLTARWPTRWSARSRVSSSAPWMKLDLR